MFFFSVFISTYRRFIDGDDDNDDGGNDARHHTYTI